MLNPELDSQNYKHINSLKCREKVIDMTNEFSLVDIWRELNARCKRFTWRRSQPVLQQSRLDFFLIHENLAADIIASDIEPGYRTDQSAVTITFRFTERAGGKHFGNLICNNGQGTWSNNADGKVLHLQMQMFKNHSKLYLFFERS